MTLRHLTSCVCCGDDFLCTPGRSHICRPCRVEHRIAARLAHAAVYGDFDPARRLIERVTRFESGDFS